MKPLRLLAFALLLALSNLTHAQWISIPDTNFGKWLNTNGFSQCLQGNNSIGWQLDTTCSAVRSAHTIQCTNKGIADLTGIQYFDSLNYLDCSFNSLTFLPPLPYFTLSLKCGYNQLNTLPDLPVLLQVLMADYNNLTDLPAIMPAYIYELSIIGNQFPVCPLFPATLTYLRCSINPFNSLSELPPNLISLECAFLQLDSLPTLPATLEALDFSNNLLTELPALPASLTLLNCSNNEIDTLPLLPNSLTDLTLGGHTFAALPPVLPDSLRTLFCFDSPLFSQLPPLPQTITQLGVDHCNISQLPELPDWLMELNVSYNPIYCLPELKHIEYLNFDSTFVTCLPNMPTGTISSLPDLATVPLCGLFNANGCAVFANITGKTYTDANNNCVADAGETDVINMAVQLWQNGAMLEEVSSALIGSYSFNTSTFATYQVTIDTSNIPFRILCPASGSLTSVLSAADSMDFNMDFALECKPGFDLEARSVTTNQVFRPANFNTLEVAAGDASNFYSGHCAAGVSGSVTLSFTGPVKYVAPAGAALTPTVTGNTLTYNIANFGTVNFFTDFDIVTQTDTTAQAGQQVCFTLSVTPSSGDNNPANNAFNICYTVVNSYDPNDKQAYPAGNIDTLQEDLVYTVRFQNTGNAEAQHIYITDTLDANVRPETFELLAYSHAPMVQLDGNNLRFNFPNINLPDSFTNEPASHGYVQYRVKLKENLPIGTTINNTAFIYFDFNPPVITNTATNTVSVDIDTTVGIQAIKNTTQVFVYPNPASNMVTVTLGENVPNSIVTITDIVGRTVLQPVTLTNTRSATLSTGQLPGGVYLVNVKSPQGMQVTKRLLVSR